MDRKQKRSKRNVGSEYLDPEKLQFHRRRKGVSVWQIASDIDITRNTVYAAFRGDGVRPHTATAMAAYFRVPVEALRFSRNTNNSSAEEYTPPCHPEWEFVNRTWSRWHESSNGLQYRVCKLQHRFVKDDFGRGKFYDLLGLPETVRDEITTQLTRHSQVCRLIRQQLQHCSSPASSHIAENRNTSPIAGGDAWWVVDEWIDAQTLESHIANGFLELNEIREIVQQVAFGLLVAHRANIVVRELAPSRILITENGRVVLTELELAKLPGSFPTVSADWPDDPYRAPEVEGGNVTEQSDLYSFGRIFLHALSGKLAERNSDVELLATFKLPKAVFSIIRDCLSPLPDQRPHKVTEVISALNRWRKSGSSSTDSR